MAGTREIATHGENGVGGIVSGGERMLLTGRLSTIATGGAGSDWAVGRFLTRQVCDAVTIVDGG